MNRESKPGAEATAAKPRIGFVGCGLIAGMHAGLLAASGEEYQIVAAFDPDSRRRDDFAEQWGAASVASATDVVDRSDAVYVCTWTSEHAALVDTVVGAGRHVFCEKPLAFDAAAATAMAERVAEAGVVNMVGLILRSTPAMLALREMIHSPDSGRVMNVVFRDDQYLPIRGMYGSDWRGDPLRAGRGALLEHSVHDLDLLEWLVGPVASIAASQHFFHGLERIEDSISCLLRYESGTTATLSSVWHDITSRPSQRRIEVFCERALYTLDGEWTGPLHWERVDGDEVTRGSIEGDAMTNWLSQRGIEPRWPPAVFLRAIRDGGAATPAFADAIRAHELVDAAYRSAETGGAAVDATRRIAEPL